MQTPSQPATRRIGIYSVSSTSSQTPAMTNGDVISTEEQPTQVRRLLCGLLMCAALGGACYFAFGPGYVNSDAAFSLLWGHDIAHGVLPNFSARGAPTPHPLSNLVAAALSPLGDHAEGALALLGWLALGGIGYCTYVIGSRCFGRSVGIVAALIVLTRDALLFYGALAYLDVPYTALVLAALALELGGRRRGTPVLVLLALAGLLRPDAWLLSVAYLIYVCRAETWRRRLALATVALTAPVIWAFADLAVTGDPLFSFFTTRHGRRTSGGRPGCATCSSRAHGR